MYHVPLALQCIYRRSDEGGEDGYGEEGLFYTDDLVLCVESEEDLRAMGDIFLRCVGKEV